MLNGIIEETETRDAGLAVFVADQRIVEAGLLEALLSYLDSRGLDPLAVHPLSAGEAEWLAERLPAVSGGPGGGCRPAALIVAHDLEPEAPRPGLQLRRPRLDNARALRVARRGERRLRGRLSDPAPGRLLHSSESSARAWQLVRALLPEQEDDLRQRVEERSAAFETPFPVIRRLGGGGERGKVELVLYEGEVVVCKTFRPGKERYWKRELRARLRLADRMAEIPGLLAHGEHWILMPYYQNVIRHREHALGLLPLWFARELVSVLEKLYEAGYAHLDIGWHNLIVDPEEGAKLIDLELMHEYEERPASFEESWDVAGVPPGFTGDLPGGMLGHIRPGYERRLEPQIGLDLHTLRHAPPWKQHLERLRYLLGRRIPRVIGIRLGSTRRAARRRLGGAGRGAPFLIGG